MIDPAPAPEGILDPQTPWWPLEQIGRRVWLQLKGQLTGRKIPELSNDQFASYVKLSDADADRLIENIKKYGKYPQLNKTDKSGGAYNEEPYQKWLVEEFLEKPFREQTNKKIEEAEQNARIEEIRKEAEKNKQKVVIKNKEVPLADIYKQAEEGKYGPDYGTASHASELEQDVLDTEQKDIEKQTDKITTEIDKEYEQKETNDNVDQKEEEDKTDEKLSSDIDAISDSLSIIRGSLANQISDFSSIEKNHTKSLGSLESLKQYFQIQTDLIKREVENATEKLNESKLEQTQVVSGSSEAVDTTADNEAEGIIQGVDGDVLTVKTTDGEFKQGQKISQGAGGGGFFDMIKGIAGKFLGGKGGGSPIKMSSGGIYTGSPTPLAEGTLSPGIYDKPTVGNLQPGQAVIPLNRNIGKKMFPNTKAETEKMQQPLADVMAQPLKAIGLAILSTAGSFLRMLGPLAGFFTPFVSGLVKGFSAILGVPVAIVTALLGGPAYAAAEEQDKQVNIFAKLWNDLMEKFGFDFGGDSSKEKGSKNNSAEDSPDNANAGDYSELLDMIAGKESKSAGGYHAYNEGGSKNGYQVIGFGGDSRDPKAPIGRSVTSMTVGEIMEHQKDKDPPIHAVGRYQIIGRTMEGLIDRKSYGETGVSKSDKFTSEVQDKLGIALIKYRLKTGANVDNFISEWRGLKFESREKLQAAIDKAKNASNISAAEGVQIKVKDDSNLGKFLGWSIVEGPNSGYDVGENLTMHGKEAYLQHENGISILPIENNEYSLSKNPEQTINRWKEILSPSASAMDKPEGSYADGGRVSNTRAHAARLRARRASAQRSRLGVQKVDGKWVNMGVSDQAVGSNPWWQVWNKKGATAERRKKQEALAKSLANRLNAQEARQRAAEPPQARSNSTIYQRPTSSISSQKQSAPKEKTETDLMMEEYDKLIASGKHVEAKELGMRIWNKTYRKTSIGIERIPTTPTSATANTPQKDKPVNVTVSPSPPPTTIPLPKPSGFTPQSKDPTTLQDQLRLMAEKTFC